MTLKDRRKKQSNKNLLITLLIGILAVAFFVAVDPKTQQQPGSEKASQVKTASLSPSTEQRSAPATDSADKKQIEIWRSEKNLPKELPDDMVRALSTPPPSLPPEMQRQLSGPPPELPEDLKKQLEGPPPELPPDLQAQLKAPPPELPEDIKRALATPPRVVTLDEVNTPPR